MQVNTRGDYGGLAADVFETFPDSQPDPFMLYSGGIVKVMPTGEAGRPDLHIANCVAQIVPGAPTKTDTRAKRLALFKTCMQDLVPHVVKLVRSAPPRRLNTALLLGCVP